MRQEEVCVYLYGVKYSLSTASTENITLFQLSKILFDYTNIHSKHRVKYNTI